MERGKEIFRKISKRLAISMDDLIQGEQIKSLMNRLGAHNENDLFSKLGDGSITMGERFLAFLRPKRKRSRLSRRDRIGQAETGKGK